VLLAEANSIMPCVTFSLKLWLKCFSKSIIQTDHLCTLYLVCKGVRPQRFDRKTCAEGLLVKS